MRVNIWAEEFTGVIEKVVSDRGDGDNEGEVFDGIRFPLLTHDDLPEDGGVTFWIPIDRYQKYSEMFFEAYQACVELSEQRSRS